MSLCRICCAFRADALHLHGRRGRFEALCRGGLIDRHADAAVAHLEDPAAGRADEELGGIEPVMRVVRPATIEHMRAADESRKTLDLMHKALSGEEFQRPIDGGRGRRATILPQPVEEIIGAGRLGIVENEAEDEASLLRQAQPSSVTEGFGLIQQTLRLVCKWSNGHA